MRALVLVEVRRLLSRRVVRVLLGLLFTGLVLISVKAAYDSNRDLAAARAAAVRTAAQADRARQAGSERAVASCEAAKRAGRAPPDVQCGPRLAEGRGHQVSPDSFYVDPRFDYHRRMPSRVSAVGFVAALIGFVLGASAIGAEWAAGTLQALLVWEPRRVRVLAAKAVALVGVLAAAVLLAEVLLAVAGYLTAVTRGTLGGATAGQQGSLALRALRAAGLVGFTSLAGWGVAGLLRSTGGALGVGFAYFALGESFLRGVRPGWSRWLLTSNLAGWLQHGIRLDAPPQRGGFDEAGVDPQFLLTFGRSALTLLLYVGLLLATFAVVFRRRDVT